MTAAAALPATRPFARPAQRFFRTPKGQLLVIFAALLVLAAAREGLAGSAPVVLSAVGTAAAVDVALQRAIRRVWVFPSGAVLTGLIIAFVLRVQEPWDVAAATSAIAIGSKHLLRVRQANVFNPAAVGLVASAMLFDSGQSWWGGLPDTSVFGAGVLLATGLYIADRINKLPLVLAFFAGYFLLFTATSFTGDGAQVAEIFRSPDIEMALFFAFFMADDPPTCPVRYRDQVLFGVIVAAFAWAIFVWNGALYFLPAGLLAGNAYAAARRAMRRAPRRPAAPVRV